LNGCILKMTDYCIKRSRSGSDPDVTVIVAVKNGADSLEACLLSILAQEGPKVEIIIVDGGSTDGTLQIIDRYRSRLAAVLNDAKCGVYDAWNRALEHCHSPWIAFLGCDDHYSDKTAIAKLLDASQKTLPVPFFIYSQLIFQDANGKTLKIIGQPWEKARTQFEYKMSVIHCGALHARELFDKGGFNTSFRIVGDYEFLYRQRERLGAVFVEEPLVTARAGGLSTRSDLAVIQKLEVKRLFKIHRAGVFANLYWYLGMCATLGSLTLERIRKLLP
jgi:glycosyltransferase involved in cell wall biosynthesis